MPDRYDPKLSVRSLSDRNGGGAAAKQSPPADHDPLAELAKIVSGRSTYKSAPPRSRTVPPATNASRPGVQPDPLGDLEAELLSDLQASFSTVKEKYTAPPATAPTPPEPPAAPAPPPAAREPAAETPAARLVRLAARPPPEARSPDAAPRQPPRPADTPTQERPSPTVARAEPPPSTAAPPVADPPRTGDRLAEGHGPVPQHSEPASPPAVEMPPTPTPAERPAPSPRPASPVDHLDIPNMQLRTAAESEPQRPSPAPQQPASAPRPPPQPPVRMPSARWDRPAEPPKPSTTIASRFAPPGAPEPAAEPQIDFDIAEEELFGEGAPFAEPEEEARPEDETAFGEFEFDLVPGYSDEDHLLPSYSDEELESLVKRRSGRGPVVLAAIAAVVLIAGVALITFRGGGSSGDAPPPIITADGSPTKITPLDTPAPETDQSKLIYDRVAANDTEPDTTLIPPGDQPVERVPTSDTAADNPISRVIIPGGPGFDQPQSDTPADVAAAGEPIQPIGPRRVRTVVVKPDGTIVSSEAVDPDAVAQPAAVEPAPVVSAPLPPAAPRQSNDDIVAIAGPNGGVGANGELPITPLPDGIEEGDVALATVDELQTEPVATPPSAQPIPSTAPAAITARAPVEITPAAPAPQQTPPAAQTAAVASSGMLVQVSSQRSDEAARATFRDLQLRYPRILGPYEVNVQRADLGERGVFYRARVGPFPPSDAQRLCDDLKAEGGDCILARN